MYIYIYIYIYIHIIIIVVTIILITTCGVLLGQCAPGARAAPDRPAPRQSNTSIIIDINSNDIDNSTIINETDNYHYYYY